LGRGDRTSAGTLTAGRAEPRTPAGVYSTMRFRQLLIVLVCAAPRSAARAQAPSPSGFAAFVATPVVAAAFRQLWLSSLAVREERVACIGGERDADGRSLITRIRPVSVEHADSLGAAAAASVDQCAPPEWFGTVHTHIARSQTGPFAGFSASDREVIFQWWKRWQTDATFCVLYSDGVGHCEMDGVAAPRWRRDQMILRY
jgi:hypothetical protein